MKDKNEVKIHIGELKNTCFVVMPFESLFQTQYERVIKPSIESLGIECIRGDEIYAKPDIMSDIWKSIRESRFILAELTGRNPNVLYEIGLAHAVGKPIILLTRKQGDVPFDLKSLRYRYYDINNPFWGEDLSDAIKSMALSILEEQERKPYLEGIELKISPFPEPITHSNKPIIAKHMIKIDGNWKGDWKRTNGTIIHNGTFILNQNEGLLTAQMTVTFDKKNETTIVQEVLKGAINDKKVILNGISYTYLVQGASSFYLLDNFELTISEDKKTMTGQFRSKRGEGIASFNRID